LIVKIITLAPELDSSGTVIKYLSDRGITVSLGHSQASQEIAKEAFLQGAKMVTLPSMPCLLYTIVNRGY